MSNESGNVCTWQAPMVTLLDGREVRSDSPEWRFQCEGQHILNLPSKLERKKLLSLIEEKRGAPARREIEQMILALWKADRPASAA